MTELDDFARSVPGRDPVHTYAAREVLLDCLANYDAGWERPGLTMDQLADAGGSDRLATGDKRRKAKAL
jgi:hypothetical protein